MGWRHQQATCYLFVQKCYWWLCQRLLRARLVDDRNLINMHTVRRVGGVDISFVKGSETDACACLVVVDVDTLEVLHSQCRSVTMTAPYVPGYLAFREVAFLRQLVDELRASAPLMIPDVILVDGNGVLHPNRFGLACHLGVLCGIPTVGVGKSLHYVDGLSKERMQQLSKTLHQRGDFVPLVGASGAVWGALLRTSEPAQGTSASKPVVISVGHGLCLSSAIDLVRKCTRHRIPEPVRHADLCSRAWLRKRGASAYEL